MDYFLTILIFSILLKNKVFFEFYAVERLALTSKGLIQKIGTFLRTYFFIFIFFDFSI